MSTDYGVQDDGTFEKKDVVDIREDMQKAFKQEFSQDISLRQNSPIQQIIDATSTEIASQWDAAEDAHFSSFYKDAVGEALDKKLALAGFSRLNLRPATGEVTFSRGSPATSDINIPEGTEIATTRTETRPAIPFETTEDATIFSGETEVTEVPIKALAPWQTTLEEEWLGEETNVEADTIVNFRTPVSGVDAVTNPVATGVDGKDKFQQGRDEETDPEFKLRYENSLSEGGVSTPAAIQSNVLRFNAGIVSVRVEEIRDPSQGYGTRTTVLAPGISDDTIAQAVFESRAGGTESFGSSSGTAEYPDGRTTTEYFDRATKQTVYVDATIEASTAFPDSGVQEVTDNIIRYVGGEASDEVQYPGTDIGEEVIFDQVKKRVMEVRGVVEADVFIGTSDNPTSVANISLPDLVVAETGDAEIDITVV